MVIVAYAKTKGNEIKEITLFPPPGFKQIEWMGISLVPHFRLSDSIIKRKMPLITIGSGTKKAHGPNRKQDGQGDPTAPLLVWLF